MAGTKNVSQDLPAGGVPLSSELLSTTIYKPNQGRLVRQFTALAIWIVVALGAWSMFDSIRAGLSSDSSRAMLAIPGVFLLVGLWFGYRVVNWPRFADFLIAVEAELNKVTWPSSEELKRASFVVIFTIFFLAVSLFLFDVIWQAIFNFIGVTS